VLLLGEKYTFSTLELKRLQKQFDTINTLRYKEKSANEVLLEIKKILKTDRLTLIVLNTKAKVDDEIIQFLTKLKYDEEFKNIKIISMENFLEEYLQKCYIPEDNTDLHYLDDIKPLTFFQQTQKGTIDYISAFLLLFVTFPILFYARYKIQKESPGNTMYIQDRVGLNNKEFRCIKFRSMSSDAEKDGAQFSSENDPRIFPWGEVMRKTRIDELPQIINILRGEMYLIGPRPERKHWIDIFEQDIPYYNERHMVKPGITGWAQVMYPYGANAEDAKQKLMYDLYYIKHWSAWLELKIIWKTIMVVLDRKGI